MNHLGPSWLLGCNLCALGNYSTEAPERSPLGFTLLFKEALPYISGGVVENVQDVHCRIFSPGVGLDL